MSEAFGRRGGFGIGSDARGLFEAAQRELDRAQSARTARHDLDDGLPDAFLSVRLQAAQQRTDGAANVLAPKSELLDERPSLGDDTDEPVKSRAALPAGLSSAQRFDVFGLFNDLVPAVTAWMRHDRKGVFRTVHDNLVFDGDDLDLLAGELVGDAVLVRIEPNVRLFSNLGQRALDARKRAARQGEKSRALLRKCFVNFQRAIVSRSSLHGRFEAMP